MKAAYSAALSDTGIRYLKRLVNLSYRIIEKHEQGNNQPMSAHKELDPKLIGIESVPYENERGRH